MMSNQLKLDHDLYQKITTEIPDYAIVLLDKKGKVIASNPGVGYIYGYSSKEIVNNDFSTFFLNEKDPSTKVADLIDRAFIHGSVQEKGWRIRKDQTLFRAKISLSVIRNEHNEVVYLSYVTKDLTEEKSIDDFKELFLKKMEAQKKELEQFVYITSHDLQEPIRTISNYVDLISSRETTNFDENSTKFFHYIKKSSETVNTLINDLLDYSRIGNVKQFTNIDCNQLLASIIKNIEASNQEADFKINFEKMPVISGYYIELKRVFENLIDNAIKFKKNDEIPKILIDCKDEDTNWLFTVKDNGIGIKEDQLKRVFIVFQRLHAKNTYPGTGMGLAVSEKILKLHGGSIWAESELGKGSTFFVSMPKKEFHAPN